MLANVLVVDDDAGHLSMLRTVLSGWGYGVAGAGDGGVVEMLRALRDDGFDGFFSMEPHLSSAGRLRGFSGTELFTEATRAFTAVLEHEGIPYH